MSEPRVVVVTGASAGLGRANARALGARRAVVPLGAGDKGGLADEREIRGGGRPQEYRRLTQHAAHGKFDSRDRAQSQQLWLQEYYGPAWLPAMAGALAIAWRSRER